MRLHRATLVGSNSNLGPTVYVTHEGRVVRALNCEQHGVYSAILKNSRICSDISQSLVDCFLSGEN